MGDIGQKVSGIGPPMDIGLRLQDYCSQGRRQITWWQSAAMLAQLEAIGAAWVAYWTGVTGGVSTMSTSTGRTP